MVACALIRMMAGIGAALASTPQDATKPIIITNEVSASPAGGANLGQLPFGPSVRRHFPPTYYPWRLVSSVVGDDGVRRTVWKDGAYEIELTSSFHDSVGVIH